MTSPIDEQEFETRRAVQHGEEALVNIRQALPNRWFMFDWESQAGL